MRSFIAHWVDCAACMSPFNWRNEQSEKVKRLQGTELVFNLWRKDVEDCCRDTQPRLSSLLSDHLAVRCQVYTLIVFLHGASVMTFGTRQAPCESLRDARNTRAQKLYGYTTRTNHESVLTYMSSLVSTLKSLIAPHWKVEQSEEGWTFFQFTDWIKTHKSMGKWILLSMGPLIQLQSVL